MNVLYTLDSIERGGAETFVLDLCRNASRFGITPAFVAFGGGTLESEFQKGKFRFFKIERRAPFDMRLIMSLRKLIKELEVDIVHTSQPVEAVHTYFAVAGTKVKCVQSHQGVYAEKRNKLAARLITPLVDHNIVVSMGARKWLKSELGVNTQKNFSLVYNAVDASRMTPTGHDIRAELGIDNKTFLLGHVGTFLPTGIKDQLTICRALQKVLTKHDDIALIFSGRTAKGGAAYLDRCMSFCKKEGIADRVFFVGVRDDIPDILHALDLFVFASVAEGLPLAVIEAMLSRIPVVVSDIEQLLEVTDGGRTACVFSAGDAEALANAITSLIADAKLRESISAAGLDYATRTFSMEAHFGVLREIYSGLLQDKDGKSASSEDT